MVCAVLWHSNCGAVVYIFQSISISCKDVLIRLTNTNNQSFGITCPTWNYLKGINFRGTICRGINFRGKLLFPNSFNFAELVFVALSFQYKAIVCALSRSQKQFPSPQGSCCSLCFRKCLE